MAKNFLKSSLENASFNIIFQILFRCLTFVLNAFVLRYITQAVVGVMNVRLLLLESTILYLSREAFRRSCLSKTTDHNWVQVINLLWLTLPLCQVFSFIFGYIWLYVLDQPSEDITRHYTLGVWAICISCVLEMCCEPIYLVTQAFLFVRLKVVLDSIQIFVRTVVFVPLVVYWPEGAVVAFSAAQVISVGVYVLSHYIYIFWYIKKRNADIIMHKKHDSTAEAQNKAIDDFPFESLTDFLPARIEGQPPVDYKLVRLTWSFFKQGILKQVLTEGERYIMTLFSVMTFQEQGAYDVVNNLGSLAARFIFRPIEDASYFYFSQMVQREAPINDQDKSQVKESADVLRQLLRYISSIGLTILIFGQSYSSLFLLLYGGTEMIEGPGPTLMRTHCLCILLLAINGITECYSFATMNTQQLDRYNYFMAAFSILFLLVSWGLTMLFGGVGFILANCCNMAARIIHSVLFIQKRYSNSSFDPLRGSFPQKYFLISLVASGLVTLSSQAYLFNIDKLLHLAVGVICFVVVCLVWVYEEWNFVYMVVKRWTRKHDKQN